MTTEAKEKAPAATKETEAEAPKVVALPIELVQEIVTYMQAVPTGTQPGGVLVRLLGEIQRHGLEQGALKILSPKGNGASKS